MSDNRLTRCRYEIIATRFRRNENPGWRHGHEKRKSPVKKTGGPASRSQAVLHIDDHAA